MTFETLGKHVGAIVSACQVGSDVEGVSSVAGRLAGVSVNWAQEALLSFEHGERLALLAGDVVTVDGERYTLV